MLFFPYSTDAPVYHYPIATGVIIAVNVVTYFCTTWQVFTGNLTIEDVQWLVLTFDAINPLQWLTHSFMHVNPFDLFVNMLFLWSFGLVIEGKIGSFWFSLIYFGVQIFCGALAQFTFFGLSFVFESFADQFAMGANNAIFALMAMALMWAPDNEMSCVMLVFAPRLGKMGGGATGELRIVTLATAFLFIDLIFILLLPTIMWVAFFHVLSMAMGAALALYLLRREKVDCEDWDIVSRNEWLHDYYWLCSPERKERLRHKEEVDYDPVTAALSTSSSPAVSNSAYMAARAGTMMTTGKRKVAAQAATTQTQTASAAANAKPEVAKGTTRITGKAAVQAKKLNPLRKSSAPEPGKVVHVPTPQEKAQTHPEFNRIAMLLRQAISSGSQMMAEQHFGKLQELKIAIGLSDKTLFEYVKLLAAGKQWLPALRPLQLIVAHGGPMAHDARIRIAHVQLKILHQPGEAIKTLRQIQFDSEKLSEGQRKIVAQRDQILKQCGVKPPPLVAKPPPSK